MKKLGRKRRVQGPPCGSRTTACVMISEGGWLAYDDGDDDDNDDDDDGDDYDDMICAGGCEASAKD
eukprot:15433573-Alexandrium_andersonii.AAC.1